MEAQYLKNPKTKNKFYPITKSDCIIDSFSISDLEIDKLFLDSLSVPKHLKGMSYLNLLGLAHYTSKLKELHSSTTSTYIAGENITIEGNVISAVIPEFSVTGLASELWVENNYVKKPYEYVDLGLPSGLLWATCNVGANYPEEYGYYFAWGEVEPKDYYEWSTYKWCNGSSTSLTKYNTDSANGFVDNKIVLELSDDAAAVNWASEWRMPTKEELMELYNNCSWEWITQNGVNGYKVIGNNGNSIFLPASGSRSGSSLDFAGSYIYCLSSSIDLHSQELAYCLSGYSDGVFGNVVSYRSNGFPVRSVREPEKSIIDDSTSSATTTYSSQHIKDIIYEIEITTSAALNDLNSRLLDIISDDTIDSLFL